MRYRNLSLVLLGCAVIAMLFLFFLTQGSVVWAVFMLFIAASFGCAFAAIIKKEPILVPVSVVVVCIASFSLVMSSVLSDELDVISCEAHGGYCVPQSAYDANGGACDRNDSKLLANALVPCKPVYGQPQLCCMRKN